MSISAATVGQTIRKLCPNRINMAVLVKYHTVAWFVIGVIFGYELAVANRALSVKRSPIQVTPRIYTTENVNAAIGDVASENSARNQIGGGDWKTTGIKTTTNVIRFGDIQMHKGRSS